MSAHALAQYFPIPRTKREADIWAAELFCVLSCVFISLIIAGVI